MDFWDFVSNSGIMLEIIGFVLMLKATGHLKQEGGSFTSGLHGLENVMSIVPPRFYYTGMFYNCWFGYSNSAFNFLRISI